ncbi:ATP-binding cassette domain-containing protein [Prochlorococcus marinus]|uniref:ABC transporter, ATP binding component n=1 Tax=Prochlorococcus marinus (strain MIT 9211) TaxID=93059 RepID=A9B9H6_PROM4|nr:ATP-binding cassette domain-containing protein [Prochlorococcus marinus]ABX08031.1 ABC transporter, ATP binding component [Prochlorococcus marinus str. MIT 9211]
MIRLERVTKIYPTGEVLKDITWEIKAGQRVGLVGVNGAGKSTQLKIIFGLEQPTSGEVVRQGEPCIAYLKQEFDVDTSRTVREELFQAFADAALILNQKLVVESAMETQAALKDGEYLDGLVKELGILQAKFEALNGYQLEAKIEKLLPKIGFNSKEAEQLVGDYSGGWQMRIALGKILLQDPDLLLLDEPTNHLDIETIEWLESYLIEQNAAMVIISHDRKFLDKICTHIVNTERGKSRTYLGNYTSYIEQKILEEESMQAAFERQQKDLNTQQAYIDRFRASATRSTQAKSREKMISKIDRIEAPLHSLSKPIFSFPKAPRPGRKVASIEDLSLTYGEKIIFLGANLQIEPGDHIALVGPNGSGKSTLLRLLMGLEKPEDGLISLGPHNIIPNYFEQNQSEALDLSNTVIETLFSAVPDWTQTQVRSLLGNFGFTKDEVFKHVGNLSGGEKARLALALIIVRPCNLLLLDEPTNHLDIPAKEMLENAIRDFSGSVVIVSHDRYFISKVANRIVEIRDGQMFLYRGNYNYFLDKKKEEVKLKQEELALAEKEAKRIANRANQRKKKLLRKQTRN